MSDFQLIRLSPLINQLPKNITRMNTFTLLTFLGGLSVICSFAAGVRTAARSNHLAHITEAEWAGWRAVFWSALYLTILAAPLAN